MIWLLIAAVRLTAPSDLLDNDQARPALYALDVTRHGEWIVQTDPTGAIASKPPLYTWLVAIAAETGLGVNEYSLYLPTSLSMLGIALIIVCAAAPRFGTVPALMGAGSFLLSPFAIKHLALARTDAVFALAVTAGALLAFRGWTTNRRGRWTLFWLACALATLTKGPLCLLLASGGLMAVCWEFRVPAADPRGRRDWFDHAIGVALFVALCGGWLFAAYSQRGPPVIDKLIGRELLGHAAASDSGGLPLVSFYKPTFYFLTRFAPWCVPALIGLWRVFARPASDLKVRRFERFLAAWFLVGLAIFSIAPHQRADLLLPLVPAAALLAGRELARWFDVARGVRPGPALAACTVIAAALVVIDRHILKRHDPVVQLTSQWRTIARQIDALPGEPALVDVDGPMALQMFLQVHQPHATIEEAREALERHDPVVVAWRRNTRDPSAFYGRELVVLPDPSRPSESEIVLSTNDPGFVLTP